MSTNAHIALAIVALVAGYLFRRRRKGPPPTPDAQVVEQLRAAGSDLAKPHTLEFFMYFAAQTAADHIASKLSGMQFTATVECKAEGSRPWVVLATRRMLPDVEEIERLSRTLTELCRAENGIYDGWGAAVEA
jgi:hypothetical protein